jgi:hypothetical protein
LKTLQQGSPWFLPQKRGHPQGSGQQNSDPNPTDRQKQQESKGNESTSNKRNIKSKVLAKEKTTYSKRQVVSAVL